MLENDHLPAPIVTEKFVKNANKDIWPKGFSKELIYMIWLVCGFSKLNSRLDVFSYDDINISW